jgi:hypothetical protein
MAYSAGELTIVYLKRREGVTIEETRVYGPVPVETAYGLYYKQTASDCLKYYAANIRKKFTLLKKDP